MKIAKIPGSFNKFFNRFRDLFSLKQFSYFSIYIYGLLVMPKEKKNVSQIANSCMEPICRSSLERLLCEVRWSFEKVMKRAKKQVMRILSNRRRGQRRAEVVLDDTFLEKYGDEIFGAGWYKKKLGGCALFGIHIVAVGVLIGDWLVPVDFRLYTRESQCKDIPMLFESKLTLARNMLRKLKFPREFEIDVLFDSWYLSEEVTEEITKRDWNWYSRCRSNRKCRWEGEQVSWKKASRLDKYAASIEWEQLDYETKRKRRAVVGHQRIGELRTVGKVKLAITSLEPDGKASGRFFAHPC